MQALRGDPLTGIAASQAKTVGRMIDDCPLIGRIIDARLDVQRLSRRDAVTESENLVELTSSIDAARIRLGEFLAAHEVMYSFETDSNLRSAIRSEAAKAAWRCRLGPRP